MHTVKPLDTNFIDGCLSARLIVTIEEHSIIGGLGSAVAEYLAAFEKKPPLLSIGLPDEYLHADSYSRQIEHSRLNVEAIYARIYEKIRG